MTMIIEPNRFEPEIPAEDRLEALAREIEIVTVGTLYQIGKRLKEAHGIHSKRNGGAGFEKWCKERLNYDRVHANRLIHVFDNLPADVSESDTLSNWTKIAIAAPSTPQPVREEAIAKASAGERVTAADIAAMKRDYEAKLKATEESVADKIMAAVDEQEADFTQEKARLEELLKQANAKAEEKAAEIAAVTAKAEIAAESKFKAQADKMAAAALRKVQREMADLERTAEAHKLAITNLERTREKLKADVEETYAYQATIEDKIQEERYLIKVMSDAKADLFQVVGAFGERRSRDYSPLYQSKVREFLAMVDHMRNEVAISSGDLLQFDAQANVVGEQIIDVTDIEEAV